MILVKYKSRQAVAVFLVCVFVYMVMDARLMLFIFWVPQHVIVNMSNKENGMEKLLLLNPIKSSWKDDFKFFNLLQQWNNVLTEHITKDKDNVWGNSDTADVLNYILSNLLGGLK